eukprot:TRINITY_DN18235_c0_g1_i1.p1 TRINITY_DN18235_c0_g1~~TRINITY_DN18235_c0_g1_i1.p1  ORF type:complete len:146 (+),score=55.24 TRINITY_DN18235_c0_g1_i1:1-438(+)
MSSIRYLLLVNRQGQTRLSKYYHENTARARAHTEAEIIRKCMSRPANVCSFFPYEGHKVVYRRYASLFFVVGVGKDENELSILEFIHCLVEVLDTYFENVCELDIMFNMEKVHYILEEMICNGYVVDSNKKNILFPLMLMEELDR